MTWSGSLESKRHRRNGDIALRVQKRREPHVTISRMKSTADERTSQLKATADEGTSCMKATAGEN